MSRFFFDVVRDGDVIRRDVTGSDAPDLNCAQMEAMEIWKQIKLEWLLKGENPSGVVVAIYDQLGGLRASIPLSLVSARAEAVLSAA